MLITQITVKNKPSGETLLGLAEIVFDNQLAVHNIKIQKNESGYFIAMPSKRFKESYVDIVHPINKKTHEALERILISAYHECVESENYSLCFELNDDCDKAGVIEQEPSDFHASIGFEGSSSKKPKEEATDGQELKTIPIFNYAPGVTFVKDSRNPNLSEGDFWKKLDFEWEQKHMSNSEIEILSWINKLRYATSKNIFALMNAGIISKSENYIFSRQSVSDKLSKTLLKNLYLIESYIFSDSGFRTRIYTQSNYGYKVLKTLRFEVNESPGILRLRGIAFIKRDLAQNEWFCNMAEQFRDYLEYYDRDVIIDDENFVNARANVLVYLKLGGQPFFAEAFRDDARINSEMEDGIIYDKVYRLALLAEDYKNITIKTKNANLKKQPIIVVIGENEEHCRRLHNLFSEIKTSVKIIYTHDIPVSQDVSTAHFEFINDEFVPFDISNCIAEL